MGLTLNQIVNRIKAISLSHQQVRRFYTGLSQYAHVDHKDKYPCIQLQGNTGSISLTGSGVMTFNYRLFFEDLVHVVDETKINEQDVLSDMVSIALDVIAQFGRYDDWVVSASGIELFTESDSDMSAGCSIDISIRVPYSQNVCDLPSDLVIVNPENENDMKSLFDLKYVANGTEGNTISIPEIFGKKILLITRETSPIFKVNANPDPAEFVWDNTNIILGTQTNLGERFLILYRNY